MVNKSLIRKQLEKTLDNYKPLLKMEVPHRGWIRAIRDALGMSGRQLASRMGVAQQAVARIEKDEIHGSVTLKTMRKAAEQLDCVLVYGLVPKTSLQDTVSKQAAMVIRQRMDTVNHSMALEDQGLDIDQYQNVFDELKKEYETAQPRDFWDYK